jgi:hypothetical protein
MDQSCQVVLIATVTSDFFFFFLFPLTDWLTVPRSPSQVVPELPPSIHLTASISFSPPFIGEPFLLEFLSHETLCLPRHCPLETPSAPTGELNCRERPRHNPNSIREMAAPTSSVFYSRRDHERQFTPGGGYFPRFPELCPLVLMRLPLFVARGCRVTMKALALKQTSSRRFFKSTSSDGNRFADSSLCCLSWLHLSWRTISFLG